MVHCYLSEVLVEGPSPLAQSVAVLTSPRRSPSPYLPPQLSSPDCRKEHVEVLDEGEDDGVVAAHDVCHGILEIGGEEIKMN